jgi:phosphocarrier protein FPr
VGPAFRLERGAREPSRAPAGDPAVEWAALGSALEATRADVLRAQASVASRAQAQDAAIFDVHLLFLEDEALLEPAHEGIFVRGETADRAWAAAVAAAASAWDALEDPYQRARAADLRSVGDQVLGYLLEPGSQMGTAGAGSLDSSGGAGIVIAPDLSPAQVATIDRAAVGGVACAYGGPTSHAAILTRALGLPAVVGAGAGLLAVAEGTVLVVDGDAGTVTVEPPPEAVAVVARRRDARARDGAAAQAAAQEAAVTHDGLTVPVEANIAGPRDAPAAIAAGADGVGLLRTEFLFLEAATMPGEDEQTAAYSAVATALNGRPLTVRTLDAGADKPLSYLPVAPEMNPFLGVRGLRLGLARPEQLLSQLRAVLRAAAEHPVRVMFPMVATVEEVLRARELLDEARASLATRGVPLPQLMEIGIMLEIPSAALIAEKLAPLVDFFSVGTNDLTQYTLAAERGNAGVAALADPLHPAVLRLIDRTAAAAAAEGRRVTVCGEVAGDRVAVPLLLGLGARGLSMNPAAIPAAKQAVRATDAAAAKELAREALAADSAAAVRRLLEAARLNGIVDEGPSGEEVP